MLEFKTSKENYPDNESVTAIMLLLIQFWESSTLPDSAGSGPRLSLPVAFGSAAAGARIRCRCFRRAAGTIS
ncbi:Zinc Finger Homeobox Protein 4 [Manis pentadactyla]|nr:Zinc Finger Homeobox Protein 4 [Manis pentadactyla]